MLKNSTGGISNVADLAKNMININTKWSNLNKKVDSKNKLFSQLSDYINELRRNIYIFLLFNLRINFYFLSFLRAITPRKHMVRKSSTKIKFIKNRS